MKKILIAIMFVMFAVPVMAHSPTPSGSSVDDFNVKDSEDWVVGVKADAPNLVKLSESWSLGAEISKDLHNTNVSEGWEAYAKLTWTGSIFDLSQ